MTQPNRPPCGNLTPHDQHPLNGGVDFADQGWCLGVPNLAGPPAQQPIPRDDSDLEPAMRKLIAGLDTRGIRPYADNPSAWSWVQFCLDGIDKLRAKVARARADVAEEIAVAIEDDVEATYAWEAARIARQHAVAPDDHRRRLRTALAEELAGLRTAPSVCPEDSTAGDSGTPAPQRFWWHHDTLLPFDTGEVPCAPTPGDAVVPLSACVGCGCRHLRWRRGEPITEHPEPRVAIRGNACCGGDGDEASCEVCRG